MLEILLLIFLSRNIASIAKKKRRSPTGYVVLLVLGWFAGEILGGLTGVVVAGAADVPDGPDILFAIGGAVIGIASGVTLAFVVVNSAAPLGDEYADYDDEPRLRRRRDADDEDPPRGRRYADDDDDDRPRGRRSDDEDDDWGSRRRRRDD